ncbi:unnamed protein product [Rotaria sp. Silwood2]|nr:unnamed protein product [Rotaria sp. Silwood2]
MYDYVHSCLRIKSVQLYFVFAAVVIAGNGFLIQRKHIKSSFNRNRSNANVKIYANLAEVTQPIRSLPIEFSVKDWSDIHSDSLTQQSIIGKKKSLNIAQVNVRALSSSNTETKFIKATMIDETRNLVKLIDKDISKEPIFFTTQSDHIVYDTMSLLKQNTILILHTIQQMQFI